MVLLTAIILGFILDFIFGDPRWLPHPICFIGKLISVTEKAVRRFCGEKPEGLLMGGFVLVVIVLTVTFAVPYFILTLAEMYSPVLAFAVETFMFYQIFAMRSLKEASLQVYEALKSGDLQEARKKLSWIVGRDTAELTDEEVAKAAVETVAENTSDGVIAPLFFMFIGGGRRWHFCIKQLTPWIPWLAIKTINICISGAVQQSWMTLPTLYRRVFPGC